MRKSILRILKSTCVVMIVFQSSLSAQTQTFQVKGTVTSSDERSGLPGASIVEKGTTNGTVADLDGNYSINVSSSNAILTFSFIGYSSQEIVVGSQSEVSIVLKIDTETLEEIVVIGYGTQKKSELSSSVASVNVDNLQKLPGSSIANLLQGQVSGVSSSFGSGAPGASPVVRIRGLGTIGSNSPLYVIDGIPGDIDGINPNDVESINILKDAAAATIYGSRASNGVIVVTTKRGQTGKPVVTLNSYVGTSSITKKIGVLNREQANQVSTAAYAAEGLAPLAFTTQSITNDTDWQDEMFRSGMEQKYDIGISGGSEFANYNFSVGYFDKEGNIINSGFERYNLRMNIDFKISDRIKVGQTISYARSTRNRFGEDEDINNFGNSGFSPILGVLQSLPHNAAFDSESANGFAEPEVGSGNVVGTTSLVTDRSIVDRLQGNMYVEAKIIDGLKFRTRLGFNLYSEEQVFHAPTYRFGPQVVNDNASFWELRSKTTEVVWNNVLDYNKSFGDHNVSGLIGVSTERKEFKSSGGSNNELPSNKLFSLGSGIGDANSFGSNRTSTIASIFGQFNYSFGDKYLLQASARRDGSSKFIENHYGVFSAVSLGWRISSEDFFDVGFISNLKPRFSIGKLGNQNVDDFLFLPVLSSNNNAINYPLGEGESQVVNVGTISRTLASADIKWEESVTRNIGLDFGILEDQFVFTLDYFNTDTKDMLVGVPVPSSTGITISPTTNGGEMNNKGWEFAMTYKKNQGDFKFNISGNVSQSKNKITKLGFADESFTFGHVIFDTHPTTKSEVGRSIGEFFLFKTGGLFQSQGEIDAHGIQPNAQPGDLKFIDTNNDGTLNDDDKAYLGSGVPDFEYGITFNGSYQKFDFSIFLQGSQGNEIYNGTKVLLYREQASDRKNWSADLLNAWTPSNTNTSIPRLTQADPNQNIRPSDFFMEDGSYLRLKNIQVGYSFGQVSSHFSTARIYLAAENLLTLTGYSGYDPGNTGFQQFSRGVDVGLYPIAKSVILGVQLKF